MGRPSLYSEEVAEAVINGLMEGKSLVKVCDEEGMPSRRTVLNWWEANADFCARCARAREMQADLMDDKISDLIDSVTPDSAPADRVKLAALQWRASKLAPKKYGDKITQEHTGAIEVTQIQRVIVDPLGQVAAKGPLYLRSDGGQVEINRSRSGG